MIFIIISSMEPAVFLDRDGVIIENPPSYVLSWDDVSILPGALDALRELHSRGLKIVIVTNQSVIGRGMISYDQAQSINQQLIEVIEKSGGHIEGLFMCPHAPDDQCDCRKPKPGLLLDAARGLDLDLSRSVMIGDALSDILAGQAAGVKQNILLLTGRGKDQARLTAVTPMEPYLVYKDLKAAVKHLSKTLP